ncbi:MAG: T9SS type A sorting domain-containing protein [Chitinophagales bacterium]
MKKLYLGIIALLITGSTFAQCSDLFFSEYVEGSSNNKALEIYNPTAVPVNLTGYKVQIYTNGSATVSSTYNLTGTVAAGDVFVLCHKLANSAIKGFADDTTQGGGVMNFNGNDVLALLNGTTLLDRIGNVGDTADIPFDTTTGKDHSYVRLPNIQQGSTNWTTGKLEWTMYPKDTIHLGSHTMNPCGAITDTLVRFSPVAASVAENVGTYNVNLALNAASAGTTFTADVVLTGGTGSAADINNYTTQTVSFTPGSSSATLTLTVTDDALPEGPETLIFTIRNASAPLLIGADSVFTLSIDASDVPAVPYNIGQISSQNANGQPDSVGVKVAISGTVLSIDYRATGLDFFIHDATDGIEIFSPTSSFGYTVAEGDSVAAVGTVGFFNGALQLVNLDTVYKIGTGVVPAPTVVQDLDETTEAELVRLNNVHLVTPSQWDNTQTSGFNCDITDGQGTWILRIDEQSALFNQTAPPFTFDVIGIGSQFDNSSPYTSGYEILPRYVTDLILHSGINEVDATLATVFPNPSNGNFTIRLKEATGAVEVRLFNVAGQQMLMEKTAEQTITINRNDLSAGIYVVEVTSATKVFRTKINIQN